MKCVNLPFAWFPRTSHRVSVSQHKSEGFFLSPPPQNREGRGTEAGWMSNPLILHTKYKIKFIFIPSGLHAQTRIWLCSKAENRWSHLSRHCAACRFVGALLGGCIPQKDPDLPFPGGSGEL